MDWGVFWTAAGVIAGIIIPLALWLLGRNRERSDEEFTIEDAPWVVERGLTYQEFLRHLLSLDRASLSGLTDSTAGNEITKAEVFEKSPETWSLVVFRNSMIVGYWSCFSLSPKLLKRLRSGEMYDSEITVNEIRSLQEPVEHFLYFEMFGIHPAFSGQRRTIFRLLSRSLADFATRTESENVRIAGVYANGFSEEGASLCRAFGLKPLVESVQGGQIYYSKDLNAVRRRLQKSSLPHNLSRQKTAARSKQRISS